MTKQTGSPSDAELQRLELAMEVAGIASWEFDCATGAIRFDRRATALLGYAPDDVAQDVVFAAIVHPDDLGAAANAMREHLMGAQPEYRVDYRIRTRAGDYRWFGSVGRISARGADGQPRTVSGVFTDITDRLRHEQALRTTHGRLRHAEEFARFGHWEFSIDERVMYASDGALRIYGFDHAGIALDEVQACVLPEHRPALDHALEALIQLGQPYDEEFRIRRVHDGAIVFVHSRAEYDATTRRVFGVVQDVSDRKRVEEERERLIAQLKHALEEVKTLSGILPICASCKKIRDDHGYWEQVEEYVVKHTDAQFSHGICPECLERLYPGMS